MKLKTPMYVIEEEKLENNLKILNNVQKEAGCKVLVALKGYAAWATFDLLEKYLSGATASGLWEAKLGAMKPWEVHTYAPAFKDDEIDEIADISHTVVFN